MSILRARSGSSSTSWMSSCSQLEQLSIVLMTVLQVTAEMEAADVDDLALQYAPKDLTPPAFLSVGTQRSAVKKPDPVVEEEGDPE